MGHVLFIVKLKLRTLKIRENIIRYTKCMSFDGVRDSVLRSIHFFEFWNWILLIEEPVAKESISSDSWFSQWVVGAVVNS
jgi:hypothetical protein